MRVHVVVCGNVQGVLFRHSAKSAAERLGLAGWVRNCDDGSVEVMAEGPKEKLEEFVTWCRKGPSAAIVENVDIDWLDATGEFGSFEITY